VLLNKSDLSPAQAKNVATYCAAQGIPLVGCLPYDTAVTAAMVRGEPVTAGDGAAATALRTAWAVLQEPGLGIGD
jgi:MinD superfamily P-loop ATPase